MGEATTTTTTVTLTADQYRFSGYQLPLVQWDATGPAYVQLGVQPYYQNQPTEWQYPVFEFDYMTFGSE